MRVRKAIWLPGLFAVLALALAACGGSDPTATTLPSPTATASPTAAAVSQQDSLELNAEEKEYLREVTRAERSMSGIFEGFRQILSQSYPVREVLLAALREGGVGTPFIGKLAILEALDPPDRFREDHRIWLEATRESLRIDTEAAEAIRNGDLVKFADFNGQLGETSVRAILVLSPVFCQSATVEPRAAAICTPEGHVLIGEYENGVNNLLREFMPAFASAQSTIAFRLSLTPEEIGQVLASMGNVSRNSLQEVESALETMAPPGELLADHERLQEYFSEVLTLLGEVRRLREGGDLDAARLELGRLEPVFCNARQGFESSDFKVAVGIFFAGGPGVCGGVPY